MMIECALSVLKSLNHQDIFRVIIPFARFVYLLTLQVNANPQSPVWDSIVLCVVCTCLRQNDKEKATDYCLSCKEYLCDQCTEYHRRSMASLDHTIMSTIEMKSVHVAPKESTHKCPKHRHDEKIQMYCHDHEQPCCGLCGCTEHRKCERVDTVENAVQFLKENRQIDSLLNEVSTLKRKLTKAKIKGETNVSAIENTVDENVSKTEDEVLSIVQYVENLEKEFVDEIFSTLKKGKEELQKKVANWEDGIFYTDYLETVLKRATTDNTDTLMQYIIVKEQLNKTNCKHLDNYMKIFQ